MANSKAETHKALTIRALEKGDQETKSIHSSNLLTDTDRLEMRSDPWPHIVANMSQEHSGDEAVS